MSASSSSERPTDVPAAPPEAKSHHGTSEVTAGASQTENRADASNKDPATAADTPSESREPPLPSHNPMAFANYPPLWSPNSQPKHNRQQPSSPASKPKERSQSGFSAATLSAVMSAGSKDDSRGKRFQERDANSKHDHISAPSRKVESHARLNIFGRDIGGLGKKPPGMGFGRKKK